MSSSILASASLNCLNAVSYLNYRSEWRVHLVSGIYQNSFPPQLVSRIWSVPPLPLQIAPIAPFPAYFQFPAKKHAWKSLLNAEPNTRERRRSSQPSRKAPMFYLLNMSNLVYDRIWRSWINRRGKGGNYETHYTDVCLDRQWSLPINLWFALMSMGAILYVRGAE